MRYSLYFFTVVCYSPFVKRLEIPRDHFIEVPTTTTSAGRGLKAQAEHGDQPFCLRTDEPDGPLLPGASCPGPGVRTQDSAVAVERAWGAPALCQGLSWTLGC